MLIRRAQAGVSLIELMIAVAILSILVVAGAPSFRQFMQNSQIRTTAEAIQSGINLARAEAVRRNTNVQFQLGDGAAWTVGCTVPVGDLDGDGVADCPATIQSRPAAETAAAVSVATSEVSGSSGSAAPGATFSDTINFNGLGRATSFAAGNNAVFNISNSSGTCEAAGGTVRCLRIVVSSAGQIRSCDPALPNTNIRGC